MVTVLEAAVPMLGFVVLCAVVLHDLETFIRTARNDEREATSSRKGTGS